LRNISKRFVVFALPATLLLPPIDSVFSATMPRKALAEPLLLLAAGWALSQLFTTRRFPMLAPFAVVVATSLILFWMIPRSIDLTQIYVAANGLYVICLFVVGFLLSHSLPLLSGVAKTVYALYFSSMLVASGLLYASQSTLLCSAFTLADQHRFGWILVVLGLATYFLALASVPRWLVPLAPHACQKPSGDGCRLCL
jgi:sugar phosphate permease